MVMGIANLAMATGNVGREGVGVNPLRGQNNVQGSCDMGSFPHELPGYRHISDSITRGQFEAAWGVELNPEPGLRIPNMFDAALDGSFKGLYCQGEDIVQSDPDTQHVAAALMAMECIVVQDIFLNETAKYAHVFLPGSSFLEKDGTFTNAERRISRVRKVMPALAGLRATGRRPSCCRTRSIPNGVFASGTRSCRRSPTPTPTFRGVSYAKLDRLGSVQWPCNEDNTDDEAAKRRQMHAKRFRAWQGPLHHHAAVPAHRREGDAQVFADPHHGPHPVAVQRRGRADAAHGQQPVRHEEDRPEIHPHDADERGIKEGDWVGIESSLGPDRCCASA